MKTRQSLQNRRNNLPAAWAGVVVEQDDLLPLPRHQTSTRLERHRQARADETRTDVAVAVVIVPGGFMLVVTVDRGDLFHRPAQVGIDKARLVLDGGDGGGRADNEEVNDAAPPGGFEFEEPLLHAAREIDDGIVSGRFDFYNEPLQRWRAGVRWMVIRRMEIRRMFG